MYTYTRTRAYVPDRLFPEEEATETFLFASFVGTGITDVLTLDDSDSISPLSFFSSLSSLSSSVSSFITVVSSFIEVSFIIGRSGPVPGGGDEGCVCIRDFGAYPGVSKPPILGGDVDTDGEKGVSDLKKFK